MPIQRISAREYIKQFMERAAKSLEPLELRQTVFQANETGWWVMRQKASSAYWTQIIVTYDRSLIVHGDASDIVCFSRYFGDGNDTRRDVLDWIANGHVQGIREKASIGTGGLTSYEYDDGVALDEALTALENETHKVYREVWKEAIEKLEDSEDIEKVREFIYDGLGDPEAANIGQVPSSRVLWAWALCKKLQSLLDEQQREFKAGDPNASATP